MRRAILQRLAVWLRSAEAMDAEELERYREFFEGKAEISDDSSANALMHPSLVDRFAVTNPDDAPSPMVSRVMQISRDLADAAREGEAEAVDGGLAPPLHEDSEPAASSRVATPHEQPDSAERASAGVRRWTGRVPTSCVATAAGTSGGRERALGGEEFVEVEVTG